MEQNIIKDHNRINISKCHEKPQNTLNTHQTPQTLLGAMKHPEAPLNTPLHT